MHGIHSVGLDTFDKIHGWETNSSCLPPTTIFEAPNPTQAPAKNLPVSESLLYSLQSESWTGRVIGPIEVFSDPQSPPSCEQLFWAWTGNNNTIDIMNTERKDECIHRQRNNRRAVLDIISVMATISRRYKWKNGCWCCRLSGDVLGAHETPDL